MKKIFLTFLCVLCCVLCIDTDAQVALGKHKCDLHKNRAEFFAHMRAKKMVYLVDAMELTETEKAAFSVLFEKNESETGECYRALRIAKRAINEESTDEEYKNAVKVVRIQMLKIAELRAKYLEELEKILPAEKIYKLYEAEEAYKKLLINDMGKCRRVEKK